MRNDRDNDKVQLGVKSDTDRILTTPNKIPDTINKRIKWITSQLKDFIPWKIDFCSQFFKFLFENHCS